MRTVIRFLKPYAGLIGIAAALVVVRVFGELLLPDLMSKIVDIGIVNMDTSYIIKTGVIMLLTALISTAAIVTMDFFATRIAAGFARDVRRDVFRKVESFSVAEFDKFGSASLITRSTNDITQIQMFFTMFMRIVLMAPIMAIGAIFMAFSKNPGMSMVIVIAMPFLIATVFLISRKAIPISKTMQKRLDRINLILREKLNGLRVIRAFSRDEYEQKRFDAANTDLTKATIRLQRISSLLMPLLMIILNLTTITAVWIGAGRISTGSLMVGDLMAIVQYIMQIMMALMMLSAIFVIYPRAQASAERVAELLNTQPILEDGNGAAASENKRGQLEFSHVTFRYPGAEEPVLSDISFRARPGETTAVIGSTGSGKSTLIKMIPRLYDVTEGSVKIDGVDVREFRKPELREKIGYVPQKAMLFSGTIADNIRDGRLDAADDEVIHAAEIAQAADFIWAKKENFSFQVAQGGANFSGGQKQRLAIARAIVRRPEIFIFDDSFSALDFKTDAALRSALREVTQEATVLIVAQRVSTIMGADQIIVLDEGRVAGCGKHDQLLQTCDVYREIVESQLAEEERQ